MNRLLSNNAKLREYPELVAIAQDFDRIASGNTISFEPIKIIESIFTVGTGTNWNRAVSRINELELTNKTLTERLVEAERKSLSKSSVDTTSQYSIAALKSENERLASQIDSLKKSASVSAISGQQTQDYEVKLRTANNRIQELELLLKTANSRIKSHGNLTQRPMWLPLQTIAKVCECYAEFSRSNATVHLRSC